VAGLVLSASLVILCTGDVKADKDPAALEQLLPVVCPASQP
jgi:hypothetical protein